MITIKKSHQPLSLTKFRACGGKTYEHLDSETKNDLRESLLKEQGYLCAYCMKPIGRDKSGRGNFNDVKIEHVIPRSVTQKSQDPDIRMKEIDYTNMVAVCQGRTNGISHCDTSKGNKEISFTPCDHAVEKSISYSLKDGRIRSDNALWSDDITGEEKLNLNHPTIMQNRQAALDGFVEFLKRSDKWSVSQLNKFLYKLTEDTRKQPYVGILQYYLNKKLSQKK